MRIADIFFQVQEANSKISHRERFLYCLEQLKLWAESNETFEAEEFRAVLIGFVLGHVRGNKDLLEEFFVYAKQELPSFNKTLTAALVLSEIPRVITPAHYLRDKKHE